MKELPVRDPARTGNETQPPRAEGEHYFEDWCNACGAGQPSGECSVCPHLPFGIGGKPVDTKAEHYARRPCSSCGSVDLRSVRVRCNHLPGRCAKCDRQTCLNCRSVMDPEWDWEKTTYVIGDCVECAPPEGQGKP